MKTTAIQISNLHPVLVHSLLAQHIAPNEQITINSDPKNIIITCSNAVIANALINAINNVNGPTKATKEENTDGSTIVNLAAYQESSVNKFLMASDQAMLDHNFSIEDRTRIIALLKTIETKTDLTPDEKDKIMRHLKSIKEGLQKTVANLLSLEEQTRIQRVGTAQEKAHLKDSAAKASPAAEQAIARLLGLELPAGSNDVDPPAYIRLNGQYVDPTICGEIPPRISWGPLVKRIDNILSPAAPAKAPASIAKSTLFAAAADDADKTTLSSPPKPTQPAKSAADESSAKYLYQPLAQERLPERSQDNDFSTTFSQLNFTFGW